MLLRKTILSMVGRKEDTSLGDVMKKDSKNPGFINPNILMETGNFIIVMSFKEIIQRLGLT